MSYGKSVRYFGARGDGTTDDSAAFQTALNVLASEQLYVDAGTYVISKSLYYMPVVPASGFVQGLKLTGAGDLITLLDFCAIPTGWPGASHAVAFGTVIQPTNHNPSTHYFVCTVAGTTGSGAEPTWTQRVGCTTTDGGVTWSCLGNINPTMIIMPQNVGQSNFISGTVLRDFGVISTTKAPVASAIYTRAGYREKFINLTVTGLTGDAIQAPSMVGDPDGSNITVIDGCRLFGNSRWGFLGYCTTGSNKSCLNIRDSFIAFNGQGGILWQGQLITGDNVVYAENGLGICVPFVHGLTVSAQGKRIWQLREFPATVVG